MYHLKNAGKFKDCGGILLGQFTDITNSDMPEYTVIDCISEILADVSAPVMYDLSQVTEKRLLLFLLARIVPWTLRAGLSDLKSADKAERKREYDLR